MQLEQSFMPLMIAFGWLSGMLLIGVFLRAKVPLFQRFLFPACLIGGLLGFVLVSVGWVNISDKFFTLMAYHLFNIGFVSIGLTGGGGGKGAAKTIIKGSVWLAFVWTALLCIQSALGAGIIAGANTFVGDKLYAGIGFLMGHGFAQGPGQTLGIASVWGKRLQDTPRHHHRYYLCRCGLLRGRAHRRAPGQLGSAQGLCGKCAQGPAPGLCHRHSRPGWTMSRPAHPPPTRPPSTRWPSTWPCCWAPTPYRFM